ncbi:hypothetical protein FB451DRAFT_1415955 [Mycena latifolia]|nr:hypothetical protein FB451DRAFT_1415955 [Mycena latifolia]
MDIIAAHRFGALDKHNTRTFRLGRALGLTAGFDPGLYPLLSCFISTTTCFLDVYTINNVVLTEFSFRLRMLGRTLSNAEFLIDILRIGATDERAAIRGIMPKLRVLRLAR